MCHHAGKNKNIEFNLFLIHSIFKTTVILSKSTECKPTVLEFVNNTDSGYAINLPNT